MNNYQQKGFRSTKSIGNPEQKSSLVASAKTDDCVNRSVQVKVPKEISLTSSMVIEGDDALEIMEANLSPTAEAFKEMWDEDEDKEIIAEYIRKYIRQSFHNGMIILSVKFKERTIISGWVGLNKTEYYENIILEMIELAIKEDLTMLV